MFKVWVQDSLLGWAPLATHFTHRNDAAIVAVSLPRDRTVHVNGTYTSVRQARVFPATHTADQVLAAVSL